MLESTNPSSPFFNADYGPESTGSIALQISMSFPPSYSSTDSNYMALSTKINIYQIIIYHIHCGLLNCKVKQA